MALASRSKSGSGGSGRIGENGNFRRESLPHSSYRAAAKIVRKNRNGCGLIFTTAFAKKKVQSMVVPNLAV